MTFSEFSFNVHTRSLEYSVSMDNVHIEGGEYWAQNNLVKQIICDYEELKTKWRKPFSENKGAQR